MKSVPLVYRLVLIGVLPLIALALYVKGQQYDPALINFKAAARQEASSSSAAPQTVQESPAAAGAGEFPGFLQIGRAHTYAKDNLYEHVDGHAEYFIGAGFVGLTVSAYKSAASRAAEAEIQAEVYDMGKSIQAFGVLADESGENASPAAVGVMGFKTSGGVNFIKGRYYVKISGINPKAAVLTFARAFADTLPAGKDSFQVFAKLPDIGKIETTRFVKEGYRGLDFLHNVIEREYSTGGKKITVALITGSENELRAVLSSFHGYFEKSRMPYEKTERDKKEVYKVADKYEGTWFLIQSRDAIFAVFGTDDEGILGYFTKGKG